MASWPLAIPNSFPPCPSAWPVAESISLAESPIMVGHAARTKRLPSSKRSPTRRKQNPQPVKQAMLKQAMLDGTCTLSISGQPITFLSKRDHYSVSPSSRKGSQNPHRVLRQTKIKQDARNGQLKLSLDDINELCKVLARISLSDSGISRPSYTQMRTPICKSNKVRRQRSLASSPSYSGSCPPLAPESSGSSARSIFSSTSLTPDTPNTPPLSPSPSSLKASRLRRNNRPGGSNFSPTPASCTTSSSAECSPSPSDRRHNPTRRTPSKTWVNEQTHQTSDGYSRHTNTQSRPQVQPIVASPVSKFFKYRSHTSSRTTHTLDHDIATFLLKGPPSGKNTKKATNGEASDADFSSATIKKGFIYVLSRPTSRGFVKIGQAEDVDGRIKYISQSGAYGYLTQYNHPQQRPIRHFKFGEDIVKKELCNIRYTSDYTPTFAEHITSRRLESGKTEWYHTNEEHAFEVVSKWREWLDCYPYDEAGRMGGFWRKRIQNREKYDQDKHGDMHARWSALLKQPTENELRLFKVAQRFNVEGTFVLVVLNAFRKFPPWVLASVIIILLAVLYISA